MAHFDYKFSDVAHCDDLVIQLVFCYSNTIAVVVRSNTIPGVAESLSLSHTVVGHGHLLLASLLAVIEHSEFN